MNQEISFKSGISIECVLEIRKRIDELGNIHITSYSVITVNGYTEAGVKTVVERVKKRNISKEPPPNQIDMFGASND
jgi:hypothetical protein